MEGYMTLRQTFLPPFQYGLIMVMPLVVLSEFHSIHPNPNYLKSDASLVPVHPHSRFSSILVYEIFTDLRRPLGRFHEVRYLPSCLRYILRCL